MTSVKEFRVAEPATASNLGRGRFVFTDAYSVFDWGQMPDDVPRKGASLCVMGAYNFEELAAAAVPTHYRGVVDPTAVDAGADPESAVVPLAEARTPPTEMAIELAQVPELPYRGPEAGYDYEAYHAAGGQHYLVPLEVVFRNTVPVGSSLRRRATPTDVGLEATEWPDEPVSLPEPIVEFSTKYEERDRYLSRAEADAIAGRADVASLEALARRVNRVVTDRAEATGFTHHDGKIECLYDEGELRVADVVGTFDENRFAWNGHGVSKEVVRQWYKRSDPTWVEAVSRAKRDVTDRDIDDWRTLCTETPEPLPDAVLDAVSTMYAAGANAYTERTWFDVPPIDEALQTVERVVGQ